jgi:predicted outer membrane protein
MSVLVAVLAVGASVLWSGASWAARPGEARMDPLVPGPNGELPAGWVQTEWGAFGPVDRSLVEGVRRADLWEGQAGKMAVAKGESQRVKEIGGIISGQHLQELDPLVLKVGSQLGIAVPDQPSAEQQGWLDEMQNAEGAEFDQIFVARLRAAHAKVFSLIATVRANTRNSVMRTFAQTANKYVDGHIQLLDSTNLVAFNALPTPAAAVAAAAVSSRTVSSEGGLPVAVIWLILAIALAAGAVTAVRVVKPR